MQNTDEIWRLVTAALNGGQARFHVHVFPFRMTEENLTSRGHRPWASFWRDLQRGYDAFVLRNGIASADAGLRRAP